MLIVSLYCTYMSSGITSAVIGMSQIEVEFCYQIIITDTIEVAVEDDHPTVRRQDIGATRTGLAIFRDYLNP